MVNFSHPYRCGHVKLADFGSVARLSSGEAAPTPATADYVAPELLAAAACAARHAVCLECCRGVVQTAVVGSLGLAALLIVQRFIKGYIPTLVLLMWS